MNYRLKSSATTMGPAKNKVIQPQGGQGEPKSLQGPESDYRMRARLARRAQRNKSNLESREINSRGGN